MTSVHTYRVYIEDAANHVEVQDIIRDIQLEAWKEGMQFAARICSINGSQCWPLKDIAETCDELAKIIRLAADDTKELPEPIPKEV